MLVFEFALGNMSPNKNFSYIVIAHFYEKKTSKISENYFDASTFILYSIIQKN